MQKLFNLVHDTGVFDYFVFEFVQNMVTIHLDLYELARVLLLNYNRSYIA